MTSAALRPARAARLLRPLAVAPAFCLGLLLGWWLWPSPTPTLPSVSPGVLADRLPEDPLAKAPATPPEPPVDDGALLHAALREARANCVVAALTGDGLGPAREPLFRTAALRAALETELIQRRAYGELESIELEADWLSTLDPSSDLGERTWEDVRFLLGGVHWYLEGSAEDGPPHGTPDHAYDHSRMRAFQGLEFSDLLGLWD